jgi:hypothetical protein
LDSRTLIGRSSEHQQLDNELEEEKKKKKKKKRCLLLQTSMRECFKSHVETGVSPSALFIICNFYALGINLY